MSPSPQGWTALAVPSDHFSPTKLYVKLTASKRGINVHITSILLFWEAANTSKTELCQEALDTACPIDPSEDEEQYKIFISKLEDSLTGRNGGMSQISKRPGPPSVTGFEVHTSIPLPRPLGRLEWTFTMKAQPKSASPQQYLLFPSLQCNSNARKREEDLRRIIKDKDHALSRLMDKMEGSGVDLAMVFPGFAGGKKKLTAKQATKAVPGLGPFEEVEWEQKFPTGSENGLSAILDDLEDGNLGDLPWDRASRVEESDSASSDEGRGSKLSTSREPSSPKKKSFSIGGSRPKTSSTHKRHGSSESSSESVSPEPERRRVADGERGSPAPRANLRNGTDTGTPTPSPSPPPKRQKTGMGVIRGQRSKDLPPSSHRNSSPAASKSTSPPTVSRSQSVEQTKSSTPSRPKAKLGAIGGKKTAQSLPFHVSPEKSRPGRRPSVSTATMSPSPGPEVEKKLEGDSKAEMADPIPEAVEKVNDQDAEPEMTGPEKADLNRQRLNSTLATGRGGKKKRKF